MKKRPITRVLVVVMSLLLICTSVLAVPSTAEAAAKPTKITLSATQKTLYVGEKYTLKVKKVSPNKASKAVKYETSNSSVATVNAKGLIVAKKKGTATITVTSKSNKKAVAKCKVTVKQQVKEITVKNAVNKTVVVRKNKSLTLKTSVAPSNASNKKVTYTISGKKGIATVNSKGVIKAKKVGTTYVTIKSKDGKKSVKIKVVVPKKVVASVKLSAKNKTIKVGESFTLKATVNPTNATNKNVTWKSSNTKVATVNSEGKVKGIKKGTAKITVTTLDGSKKATCTVTVKPVLVSKIKLSASSKTLNVGQTEKLTATVTPKNAANKAVTWKSSNTKVATVDGKGNVKAIAPGTANITATAKDGSKKSASCAITVNPIRVTNVSLNQSSATLDIGKTVTLTATVTPSNATNKAVTWTTNNSGVATVANGVVTAKAAGTAIITATADGKSAVCTITVKNPVIEITDVTLPGTKTIYANTKGEKLVATVVPANTTMSKTVTFTSDNTALLNVTADGTLIPNTDNLNGVTTDTVNVQVTATTVNGKKATATVTIILRERANAADDLYSFNLDKKAETYDVTKKGKAISVTPETIAEDIKTLAAVHWSNATLKNNWNDAGIQKVMALLLAQEFDVNSRAEVKVTSENTMRLTAKGKTVVVTRQDNANGTSTLKIVTGDKTVYLENITVTEKDTLYTVNTIAKAGSVSKELEIEIAKNASSVIVKQKYNDGTTDEIISVVSNADAYQIKIEKSMYKTLLDMVGIADPIPTTTVYNCYVPEK